MTPMVNAIFDVPLNMANAAVVEVNLRLDAVAVVEANLTFGALTLEVNLRLATGPDVRCALEVTH